MFAGQHNETIDSLLETQDSIVQQIVSSLQEKINYNLLSHSYKKKSVDLIAYENYLIGMNILKKGTAESDIKARAYFNDALKINEHFSLAYTGLSLSYFNFWSCMLWDRWDISQKGAHEYALKAIELDPNDYTALGVLGRTYVYLGEYEKAEHYLRKSLRMNPNDTSHLIRVAYSLMYLCYPEESVKLYHKALELNPFHTDHYYAHGSSYYLEIGDFETSIALSKKVNLDAWTDFPAFVAAAYFHVKDYDNMLRCWDVYIEQFKKKIYTGKKEVNEEAVAWLSVVNPYKGKSNLHPLMDYMLEGKKAIKNTTAIKAKQSLSSEFKFEGDVWNMTYKGDTVILKDAKGFHDIQKLLNEPDKQFHCLDLMNAAIDEVSSTEAIDKKAKQDYLQRIKVLQEDIVEAETSHQVEKALTLQNEYDTILSHLSNSLGLAGKSRKVGSTIEKARSAVTWRIRSAIKKINEQHPALGNHLSKSIKTGTFCVYQPELEVYWQV